MITGKTRYYAILGDPIEQALSPVVHNAAFEALGMDAVMLGCRVTPEELKKAVEGTRALHFEGLAVTMPHKTAIIPLLDEWEEKLIFWVLSMLSPAKTASTRAITRTVTALYRI